MYGYYLFEVRKQVLPAPARISKHLPAVEVVATAAVPAHGVEDAAASKNFTLRQGARFAIEEDLRHHFQLPIVLGADGTSDELGNLNEFLVLVPNRQSASVHRLQRPY